MKCIILTNEQKISLENSEIASGWNFNVIQDCNDNWVLTETQIVASTLPQNDWIKSLPLIDLCPKPEPDFETLLGL